MSFKINQINYLIFYKAHFVNSSSIKKYCCDGQENCQSKLISKKSSFKKLKTRFGDGSFYNFLNISILSRVANTVSKFKEHMKQIS